MLNDLFQSLLTAHAAAPAALENKGRIPAVTLAVVTRNDDPEDQRRILVSSPFLPGLDSSWIRRLQMMPGFDPPMPTLGQTVMLLAVAGDYTNAFYIPLVNATNAPIPGKADAEKDSWQQIPGDITEEVRGKMTVDVGQSIRLQTSSGSSLELAADGNIYLEDASGNKLVLGGSGLTFTGNDVKFGGKSAATIGAVDSAGHPLVSRGW